MSSEGPIKDRVFTIFTVLFLIASTSVFIYSRFSAPEEGGMVTFVTKEGPSAKRDIAQNQNVDDKKKKPEPPRDLASGKQKGNSDFDNSESLFKKSDSIPEGVSIRDEVKSHAQPVELNSKLLEDLSVGSRIQLDLPEVGTIDAEVIIEKQNKSNSKTYIALIDNQSPEHKVILTVGESYTFATIYSKDGSFSMQANNGSGYVINQIHEQRLVDPSKPDYVKPPKDMNKMFKRGR